MDHPDCPNCELHTISNQVATEAAQWKQEMQRLRKENIDLLAELEDYKKRFELLSIDSEVFEEVEELRQRVEATNVRVGFSRAKGLPGLMSCIIMKMTGVPYSHVWLLYRDHDFKEDMVMEAHTEWRLIPFRDFKKKNVVVDVFKPSASIDAGLAYGGRLLGTRYDAAGLLGNLWVMFGEWFKRKWRNPFRSNRTVFCSEGVARVMIAAKYPGLNDKEVHEVRPQHLFRIFTMDGSKRWHET